MPTFIVRLEPAARTAVFSFAPSGLARTDRVASFTAQADDVSPAPRF